MENLEPLPQILVVPRAAMFLLLERLQDDIHVLIAINMAIGPATVSAQNRAPDWVASCRRQPKQKCSLPKFVRLKPFKLIKSCWRNEFSASFGSQH